MFGSSVQHMVKYLPGELQPLANKIDSYVKKTGHFIELLKLKRINNTNIQVSFDVKYIT